MGVHKSTPPPDRRLRFGRSRRIALATSGLLLVGAMSAPVAMAAPTCVTAGATVTCTYNAGGSTQVAIPAGATSVSVVADGAGGGGGVTPPMSAATGRM